MTRIATALALAAVAAALAGQAQAHAALVKADPAKEASVGAAPTINLQFSEKVEPKFSGAQLMKANGDNVPVTSKASGNTIVATPKAPLKPGSYMVMWYAVADDGHRSNGDYNFTVK